MSLLQGLTLASRYVTHRLNSTSVQVLHSPFVYRLYTECIKKDRHEKAFAPIEQLRHILAARPTPAHLSRPRLRFARGQKQCLAHRATHCQIQFKTRSTGPPAAPLGQLYSLPATVLELGSSLGISTSYMAAALPPQAKLHTVEGAAPVAALAQAHIQQLGYSQQVQLTEGLFDEVLPALLPTLNAVDLAYIDGNHRYAAHR
jgi:protein-L-isoaspartate O-methyltransferase